MSYQLKEEGNSNEQYQYDEKDEEPKLIVRDFIYRVGYTNRLIDSNIEERWKKTNMT